MLTVRTIDNTDTVALLSGCRPIKGQDHEGVFALLAEEQGELAGFAVARSCPKAIVFFGLEGDTKTCRLLLERLVRRAGERAVCGWCPVWRSDLRRLLRQMGFAPRVRERLAEKEGDFYHLRRII